MDSELVYISFLTLSHSLFKILCDSVAIAR